jgi:aminocarboxymuconate-semialdehyde decarboxylase
MLKIDMHTHILPAQLPDFASQFGYGEFIKLDHHRPGFANMYKGSRFFREIGANCWDPTLRVEEYARAHTQVQVICTIPVMFSYWAKPTDTLAISRFLNDHIARVCQQHPQHYIGLGTLPMQDTNLAIAELERIHQMGFAGVQIGSNVNQLNLHEPQFRPIFEAMAALNMAVLIHPWEMMGEADMTRYWLPWLVGMPAETARAACSLVFGGILEQLPHLRICLAHAGGSFVPTIGRIKHGFDCRPDLVAPDNPVSPELYLPRFWYDSATHDPVLLRYIADQVGADRICLGTDYPFPLGDPTIGAFMLDMDFTEQQVAAIFAQNTLDWLGMLPPKIDDLGA